METNLKVQLHHYIYLCSPEKVTVNATGTELILPMPLLISCS